MHRKAEEVRLGNGPENLRAMIENVEKLFRQDQDILEEVCFLTGSYLHSLKSFRL
jgi:hypothetical protein